MKTMVIELTFTEPLLGGVPLNRKLVQDYVATGHEEEQETVYEPDDEIEKLSTGFHRENGEREGAPFLYDYVIKGFFKDVCGCLRRVPKSASSSLKAYKKVIDGLIFVTPRRIPLGLPKGAALTWCERPLRAQTAQGERIALARSEQAPAGTTIGFTLDLLDPRLKGCVQGWLQYGSLRGLGQWRNSGMGRFSYAWDAD